MKLIKTKEENLEENYLELHYDTIDEETSAVLDRLRDTLRYIEGTFEDKKVTVALTDIFYIETVDRKTFAYTKDMCFEIKEALRDILEEYSNQFITNGFASGRSLHRCLGRKTQGSCQKGSTKRNSKLHTIMIICCQVVVKWLKFLQR